VQLVEYQLPMLVASLGAARFLSSVKRNPLIAVASQIFLSFRLTPAVLHSLVKPFAVGFKVTPRARWPSARTRTRAR
jgi:hypothetical protein